MYGLQLRDSVSSMGTIRVQCILLCLATAHPLAPTHIVCTQARGWIDASPTPRSLCWTGSMSLSNLQEVRHYALSAITTNNNGNSSKGSATSRSMVRVPLPFRTVAALSDILLASVTQHITWGCGPIVKFARSHAPSHWRPCGNSATMQWRPKIVPIDADISGDTRLQALQG
jgi:hypothetical protein